LVRLKIVPAKIDPINQASSQVGRVLVVSTVKDANIEMDRPRPVGHGEVNHNRDENGPDISPLVAG
jgi:hypothetical protein